MVKAVVDVGSNSVLLLVARLDADQGWVPVFESTAVTGLGQGTKTTGLISPDGAASTLEALSKAFADARLHGAESVLAGGTMALRIARNAQDFLAAAKAQDTPVTIVSGEDEARLGFLAVAEDPAFSDSPRISIVDPGGHSTELVTSDRMSGGKWNVKFRKSFSVGALGLRETAMPSPRPTFSERLVAVDQIDSLLGMQYLPRQCGRVVVLGATGTNLVTIREEMTVWQPEIVHAQTLDFEEVSRAVGWLCDMDDLERAQVVGLELGREKSIHIGALILERFLQCLHALECQVSVRGWRHALLEHSLEESAVTAS